MSKELTPLEAWNNIKSGWFTNDAIKIVETALKNYDGLCGEITYLKNKHKKEHKALEIIKNKSVDVALLRHLLTYNPERAFELYNKTMLNDWNDLYVLTQEEYDLLKEVLL